MSLNHKYLPNPTRTQRETFNLSARAWNIRSPRYQLIRKRNKVLSKMMAWAFLSSNKQDSLRRQPIQNLKTKLLLNLNQILVIKGRWQQSINSIHLILTVAAASHFHIHRLQLRWRRVDRAERGINRGVSNLKISLTNSTEYGEIKMNFITRQYFAHNIEKTVLVFFSTF